MKARKPKTVIAPKGCYVDLTEGKEYEVIGFWDELSRDEFGYGFNIIDDTGKERCCLERKCAHIRGDDWIIKEYENE